MACSAVNYLAFADYNGTEFEVVVKFSVNCRVQDVSQVPEIKK